jgi:putative GTP pyrophosphokinase
MQRNNLPLTLEDLQRSIHDVAGVRVVCSFPEDVYMLAEALLAQDDILLIEKKDYIAHPKENGYRSLHLIVAVPIFLTHEKRMMEVEIQLRTIAMDFWAELEHQLRYKKDVVFTDEMAKELPECAEISAALDSRMECLRREVFASITYEERESEVST